MKILHVNNYHYPRGGSDRYFLNVARALSERGHEVRTLATRTANDVDEDLRANVDLAGMELDAGLALGQAKQFFYNATARQAMRDLIEDFKPDVAHLHIYYGQITPSILQPLKAASVPIVQTLHEYKIVCPAQYMIRNGQPCDACKGRKYWHALAGRCNRGSFARTAISTMETVTSEALGARRHVDRFLAVSHFQRDRLVHMGLDEEKVSVLHNFSRSAERASDARGDYFLFVGRIAEGKGLETLLRAYALYLAGQDGSGIPLHIVGTGPDYDRLNALSRTLGIDEQVKWLGYSEGAALASEYRGCLALINPSELSETFGLTSLEAMGHGRAVIFSDRGALPEVARDGIDGYLVPAGDVSALSSRMTSLTHADAARLGNNGYLRANSEFSEDVHIDRLVSIYAEMVGP